MLAKHNIHPIHASIKCLIPYLNMVIDRHVHILIMIDIQRCVQVILGMHIYIILTCVYRSSRSFDNEEYEKDVSLSNTL